MGCENVKVIPYEKYKNNVEEFALELSDYYELPYNNIINCITKKTWNRSKDRMWERIRTPAKSGGLGLPNAMRLVGDRILGNGGLVPSLNRKQELNISQIFSDSNRNLAKSCSLDLERYGYSLPK